MPVTSAAAKALRQNIKARARNTAAKQHLKKLSVRLRKAIVAKNTSEAKTIGQEFIKALDKAAQKKIIHRNVAARKKSRILAAIKRTA